MSDDGAKDDADEPAWLLTEAESLRREGRSDLAEALLDRCRQIAQARNDHSLLEAIAQFDNADDPRPRGVSPLQTSLTLFDQSRESLARGDLTVASIGFATGHALASALPQEGRELSLYMGVGLMTAQAALGNADAVVATGTHLLDIETDAESEEPDSTSSLLRAALAAGSEGDHATAERYYLQLQGVLEDQPPYPGSDFDRANVLMNRGINADSSGLPLKAEEFFAAAQSLLDRVPIAGDDREYQGLLHMNRAVTLCTLGRHDESEQMAAAAQSIFDSLAEAPAARRHAIAVRTQRGDNFRKQGRLIRADALYTDAAAFLAGLPGEAREALRSDLASLTLGRANNALALGRHAEAERLLADTEALYAGLPDGPGTPYKQAGIRLNRAVAAQRQGRHPEAEVLYQAAQDLFDGLPDSAHVRAQRATARMNRGDNLETMGRYDEADSCHAQAQALFDELPDRDQARAGGANVRINRANTLQSRGRFDEAEALYAEIDTLLADLPASLESLEARTIASQNHAINLQALGRYESAGAAFHAAQARLQGLDDSDPVRSMRATVLSNLANNENLSGRHEEAEQSFALAQQLYDALPDSEVSAMGRVLVRTNRISNLLARRDVVSTVALWPDCFQRLQALQGHSNPALPETAAVLMQALIELGEVAEYAPELCAQHAFALCRWSLDWIDIVSDPLAPFPPGAEHVATTFGLAMGWLLQSGRTERIAELLSEQFGRFASAERLSGEEAATWTTDLHPIAALRLSVRRLSGELQALESSHSPEQEDAEAARAMLSLRTRRDTEVRALQAALRSYRQADDGVATAPVTRLVNAVRAAPQGTRRALVVLFRYLVTVEDLSDPRPLSRPAAAALVVTHDRSVAQVVHLPDIVLDVAMNGQETRRPPSLVRHVPLAATSAALSRASHAQAAPANPEGWALRKAVLAGGQALKTAVGEVDELFLATHHELGHLPWQALHDQQPVRVFHGVQLAVQALERARATARITPPGPDRRIGVLAHSPALTQPLETTSGTAFAWQHPILGVYADRAVTRLQWAAASIALDGKEALLNRMPPLLQFSCHGSARAAHTGRAQTSTSAYELALAMGAMAPSRRIEAVLTVACASAQAGTNAFGESGGWSVVLHDKVDAVLGALYPVDDLLCSLFVLLLHRAWARTGELRAALVEARTRLRSGEWEQDATGEADVFAMWCSALASVPDEAETASVARVDAVLKRARDHYEHRRSLYLDDRRMRLVAESFVILG